MAVSLSLSPSPCLSPFTTPLTFKSPGLLSALAPDTGVAVYAGLVGALLLCVILVLCVGVLAYRRRCRHLHGDITDSSSALTAAFHPGNYKPSRQGRVTLIVYWCLFLLLKKKISFRFKRIRLWENNVLLEQNLIEAPQQPQSSTIFILPGVCFS